MTHPDGTLSEDQFEREMRAMRPEVDPAFAAQLDAWAAEGFPSKQQLDRQERTEPAGLRGFYRRLRERPLLPMLTGATTVLVVVSVSVAVLRSDSGIESQPLSAGDDSSAPAVLDSGSSGAAGKGATGDAAASQSTIEEFPPPPTEPVPPRTDKLRPGQERIQERDAQMTLSTDPGQVDDVADGVVEVTERYDGIVISSNVNTSADRGRAVFDLRIPTQNLSAALSDLSDLASVSSRNESVADITEPFLSAEERFDDAKAEVDALLERMGEADSADEIAQIRAQLGTARTELAAARADLGSQKQRADFSNVSLTVTGNGDADGWSIGDAVDDATSVLEDIGGATLVALAVIAPLSLIAAALWLGLRAARRRTRERTLDD